MCENKIKPEDYGPEAASGRLRAIHVPLLQWYGREGRELPWREKPEPYRVWISEIMLQQTRIEAVKPYYRRFMEELPDVAALAAVEDDRLLKLWEGLGYYSRARNLKKAAIRIMEEYGGVMPGTAEELIRLPGIGSYTAGAIASIAFGQPVPAVDGNVLRVLSRLLMNREDIRKQSVKKRMETLLRENMPAEAGAFNQGIMELGETVCLPGRAPRCEACPIRDHCLAFRQGTVSEVPVRSPDRERRIEARTVVILESGDRVALRKRADEGLLASLYELPNVEGHLAPEALAAAFHLNPAAIEEIERLPDARHVFSHVVWEMIGYRLCLAEPLPEAYISAKKEELRTIYPLPGAFDRYTKRVK